MAGWQRFHPIGLALIGLPAIRIIVQRRGILKALWQALKSFWPSHRLTAWALSGGLLVLTALNMVAVGPGRLSGIHPTLVQSGGSIFFPSGNAGSMALIVYNHAIFSASWQPEAAVIIANLSAWLIIALSTYALARRCAWPATAATVALLVVCMPRVVQQSYVANSELLPAAVILLALLALYRAVEQPRAHDIGMLTAAVAFSVSGARLCYLMPAVLAGLSLMVLRRRHPVRLWAKAIAVHGTAALVAVSAFLLFSQAAIVGYNLAHGHEWIGASALETVTFNMDGIYGALANAGRYAFQAFHFPEAFDQGVRWVFGFSPQAAIEAVHRGTLGAMLDGKGAAAAFGLSWAPGNPWGWFGPAGFFLILPAIAYALLRAPRRLKNTAAAMLAYFLAIALILAWQPQNVRFMTMFFTGSGFLVAFFMPPWRISRRGRLVLQVFSISMAGYTLLM